MISPLIKNIFRFVVIILVQVFVLDKIQVSGFIRPYLYVLFILMLPFEISGWLLLVAAFLTGLVIDIFSLTPGMHTAASVFMAFCRPGVIKTVGIRRDDLQPGQFPNVMDFGFPWFATYTLILVFLHHLALFYLEIFRLNEFLITLVKVIINTAITSTLVIVTQFLFIRRKNE
jgi:hypothetical protein